MTAVALRNLVKRYGDVTAVAGIDLEIAAGEFVVLLGPSGCGKTTTLRCIAGLEDVSDGEIRLGDQVVSAAAYSLPAEHREIGMVFQSYAIWPHMTVADNVAFGLKMKKLPATEVKQRVRQALELVGLSELAGRGASQLSGGQQQRVAFARAVVLEPKVLLFDEPLSNLDAKLRERMRFDLRQLQKRLRITSIYVTHDQQEAMIIADRIVLMHQGHIDQIGSPVEIYRHPTSRFGAEFIGLANISPAKVVANGSETRVRLPSGIEITSAATGFAVGDGVEVVCRPEDVQVSETPLCGPNTFSAHIIASYFLGNITDVFLRVGDLQLRSQLNSHLSFPEGQMVWTQVSPNSIILIGA